MLFSYKAQSGVFKVKIMNKTQTTVHGLNIGYRGFTNTVGVPDIYPGKTYQAKVIPGRIGESTMWLGYKDNSGQEHQETLFGYFESGYRGNTIVRIKSVNKDGLMQIEVKSDINSY